MADADRLDNSIELLGIVRRSKPGRLIFGKATSRDQTINLLQDASVSWIERVGVSL
jgi:hypothetical protein